MQTSQHANEPTRLNLIGDWQRTGITYFEPPELGSIFAWTVLDVGHEWLLAVEDRRTVNSSSYKVRHSQSGVYYSVNGHHSWCIKWSWFVTNIRLRRAKSSGRQYACMWLSSTAHRRQTTTDSSSTFSVDKTKPITQQYWYSVTVSLHSMLLVLSTKMAYLDLPEIVSLLLHARALIFLCYLTYAWTCTTYSFCWP